MGILGEQVLCRLDAPSTKQLKLVCRSLREEINSRVTSATLRFSWHCEQDELPELLLCLPKLPALSSVRIWIYPPTPEASEALSLVGADSVVPGEQQPLCERLRSLKLGGAPQNSAVLAAIFSVPWPALEDLMLENCSLEDSVCSAMVLATAALPRLRRLGLVCCDLIPQAFLALARGHWPHLEELDLSSNSWLSIRPHASAADQAAAVTALATSSLGGRLRIMRVSANDMLPVAATALVQGEWLCLEDLTLYGTNFEANSSVVMCQPVSLPALRRIGLSLNKVTPQLAAALASRTRLISLSLYGGLARGIDNIEHWPCLQALELKLISFASVEVPQGLHPVRFPHVSHLTLCFPQVTTSFVRALLAAGPTSGCRWPNQVQQLQIDGNDMAAPAVLFKLLASTDWPVLRVLKMKPTYVQALKAGQRARIRNALRSFLARCPLLQEHDLEQLLS